MARIDVPRSYIDNYVSALHQIDEVGRGYLADALAKTDLNNRSRVTAIMRVHTNSSAQAAADLSAAFYRGMSVLQTGEDFDAVGLSGWDPEAVDIATSACIAQGAGDREKTSSLLLDRLSFDLNRASKVSVVRNGRRDGRGVRFARVPQGTETCAWCLMTAGLGFWFMTEESASHTHRGCDCAIVPGIGLSDVHIGGYDSGAYRDMWRSAREKLDHGDVPQELLDRINAQKAAKGKRYRMDTNGVLAVMRYEYGLK